jgi:hypothetical protein
VENKMCKALKDPSFVLQATQKRVLRFRNIIRKDK